MGASLFSAVFAGLLGAKSEMIIYVKGPYIYMNRDLQIDISANDLYTAQGPCRKKV